MFTVELTISSQYIVITIVRISFLFALSRIELFGWILKRISSHLLPIISRELY